jgi:RNA polymerase sigma factor (sigma-70 family)
MDREQEFLNHLPLIERIIRHTCRHHSCRPEEAEDFASTVKVRLIADDYAVLRKFQAQSSLSTYLTVVIQRLMLDYRNHQWGKWRPSAAARRLGPLAERLECLVTRDGHSVDEACEILRTNRQVDATLDELRKMAEGVVLKPRRTLVEERELDALTTADGRPDHHLLHREREEMRAQLTEYVARALQAMDEEDRLIVRLRIDDGLQVAEIARFLGVPAKPLYRRIESIFRSLRRVLEQEGVSAGLVAEALVDPPSGSSSLVGRPQ